jgi:hypothetical protein
VTPARQNTVIDYAKTGLVCALESSSPIVLDSGPTTSASWCWLSQPRVNVPVDSASIASTADARLAMTSASSIAVSSAMLVSPTVLLFVLGYAGSSFSSQLCFDPPDQARMAVTYAADAAHVLAAAVMASTRDRSGGFSVRRLPRSPGCAFAVTVWVLRRATPIDFAISSQCCRSCRLRSC